MEEAQRRKEKKLLEELESEDLTPKAPPKKVTVYQLQVSSKCSLISYNFIKPQVGRKGGGGIRIGLLYDPYGS